MLSEHPLEGVNGLQLPSGHIPCAEKEENIWIFEPGRDKRKESGGPRVRRFL
jgi:hypothetical protein